MKSDLIRISETLEDCLLIGSLSASDYLITPESEGPVEDFQEEIFRDASYKAKR
jgi:hypothetical protein